MIEALIPIRELSKITEVNSVTIRAWERRYGLIKPQRTNKGHRLYSQEDIDKIFEIKKWLDKGISIGKIKPLLAQENTTIEELDDNWQEYINNVIEAVNNLNLNKLESLINDITASYPAKIVWKHLAKPLSKQYDNANSDYGVKTKRVFWQETIKEKTLQYIKAHGIDLKQEILIVGIDNQELSSEALFLAWQLTEAGIRPNIRFYDIPENEIPYVIEQIGAQAILLFSDSSLNKSKLKNIQKSIENTKVPALITGCCVQLNKEQLSKVGLITFDDHDKLVEFVQKELINEPL